MPSSTPAQPAFAVIVENGSARETSLAEAKAALSRDGTTVWIHASGRSPELESLLTGTLGLHPLTLEDIWVDRAAPKLEDFGSYLYVVAHGARSSAEVTELDLVLGARWLFSNGEVRCAGEVKSELLRGGKQLLRGPAFIAHALVDHLGDQLIEVMDKLDDEIEAVEGQAVRPRPRRATLQRILQLRRILHRFRRSFVHQREVLLKLSRGDVGLVPHEALPFFRDVHDHFLRLADLADDQRDALSSALEAHLSMVSNRMNEVMKVLTLISTVMLPLTFIAGVYGMNFKYMPELNWRFGYLWALGLMALTATVLLSWFKRRGWFD